jgi:hypothetical protein
VLFPVLIGDHIGFQLSALSVAPDDRDAFASLGGAGQFFADARACEPDSVSAHILESLSGIPLDSNP